VHNGDTVNITATFVEANGLTGTPTISIGGVVSGAAMTQSPALVWTYAWVVPTGNDGAAAVSISATDTVGNPSAAPTGAHTSYTIDNTPPSITGVTLTDATNTLADVTFDGPVFSDALHSAALLISSLAVTDTTHPADTATVTGITNTAGNTWRLTLSWSTTPTTNDTIVVAAATASSVYDTAGNAMASGAGNNGLALLIAGLGFKGPTGGSQQGTTALGRVGAFIQGALGGSQARGSSTARALGLSSGSGSTAQPVTQTRANFAQPLVSRAVATEALPSMTPLSSSVAATDTQRAPYVGALAPSEQGVGSTRLAAATAAVPTAVPHADAGSTGATVSRVPEIPLDMLHMGRQGEAASSPSPVPPWWILGLGTLAVGIMAAGAWLGIRTLRQKAERP
jgi:hypothetical protein